MTQSKKEKNKISIAGFGMEGKALYEYFKKNYDAEIHIFDEKEIQAPDKKTIIHKGLNIPSEFDVVYKTPGIPTNKLKLESKKTKISGLTNIFLDKAKGTIVGITGTKGKGTITSLLHHILKENGFDAEMTGNIGIAGLNLLENDHKDRIYIYELSSFQCEHLNKSPHIAVINNLFIDHQDHHESFEDYVCAKKNITKFQESSDHFINVSGHNIKTKAKEIKIKKLPEPKFETKLLGDHNQMNIAVASEIAKIFGVSEENIRKAVKTYKPLSIRLEKVSENNGIVFYDDSIATIPEATLASVKALENINTLILGGSDKGSDLESFAKELTKLHIKNFIIFPVNGKEMVKYIEEDRVFEASSMEEAVKIVYSLGKGICLLSPASASFNMFKSYKDRSEQYRYWIKKLK